MRLAHRCKISDDRATAGSGWPQPVRWTMTASFVRIFLSAIPRAPQRWSWRWRGARLRVLRRGGQPGGCRPGGGADTGQPVPSSPCIGRCPRRRRDPGQPPAAKASMPIWLSREASRRRSCSAAAPSIYDRVSAAGHCDRAIVYPARMARFGCCAGFRPKGRGPTCRLRNRVGAAGGPVCARCPCPFRGLLLARRASFRSHGAEPRRATGAGRRRA